MNETLDTHDQLALRRSKLAELRSRTHPYPNNFKRDTLATQLHHQYAKLETHELEQVTTCFKLAGRMMTRRIMGKAAFIHIQDMSGRIQVYVKKDNLSETIYNDFKSWDIGDILAISGTIFKTKTGELSVLAEEIHLLAKSLHPLPEKFHGLTDQETRYRQRYLDLIMNEESKLVFTTRIAIVSFIRSYLQNCGFLEVETPMMQVIPGGATARPFITHHNALDMQLYLRIAPELYLKRLVVGGFEKVFEMNRNFRNEGLSTRHNPEFTMVEFYQAYADYHDLMNLTEDLLKQLLQSVLGTTQICYQGEEYDFGKSFTRMTLKESISHYNPEITSQDLEDLETAKTIAKRLDIHIEPTYGLGKIQTEIFEKTVEQRLQQPTFITAYPAEVSPLARKNDQDPFITDRFEFFVAGQEIANGFSELNDPEDQAERFRNQAQAKDSGDEEAMFYDADYITALEYGMPPTAGEGIGIDRLVMLLTDSRSIRDVLFFPHMRPKAQSETQEETIS